MEILDEIHVESQSPQTTRKRTRSPPALTRASTTSTTASLDSPCELSTPPALKRLEQTPKTQPSTSRELILHARDALIQAAAIEESQEEKTRILDLIEVFREYTEKKRLHSVSSILANQVSDLQRVAQGLKQAPQPNRAASNPTPPKPQPTSFAKVAASAPEAAPAQWQVIGKKGKPTPKTNTPKKSHREKRLVLIQTVKTKEINPLQLRNAINRAFEKHTVKDPVIATISKSRIGQNVVLTTTEQFDADFLLAHESVWQSAIPYASAAKDITWHKIVAHGVPVADFDTEDGMALLKEEVEIFNQGLQVVGSPRWLTSAAARQTKRNGSVVLAFATEKEANQALRTRLYIAGSSVRTEKLLPFRSDTQCSKCQRFGHLEARCPHTYRCRLCAEGHPTKAHVCSQCQARGQPCAHLVARCSNCREGHAANHEKCEVLLTAKARTHGSFSI